MVLGWNWCITDLLNPVDFRRLFSKPRRSRSPDQPQRGFKADFPSTAYMLQRRPTPLSISCRNNNQKLEKHQRSNACRQRVCRFVRPKVPPRAAATRPQQILRVLLLFEQYCQPIGYGLSPQAAASDRPMQLSLRYDQFQCSIMQQCADPSGSNNNGFARAVRHLPGKGSPRLRPKTHTALVRSSRPLFRATGLLMHGLRLHLVQTPSLLAPVG